MQVFEQLTSGLIMMSFNGDLTFLLCISCTYVPYPNFLPTNRRLHTVELLYEAPFRLLVALCRINVIFWVTAGFINLDAF